ncbi:hypothetical protein DM860_005859 [Cuscuta australis]|uniref:Uncharacterized protein n=1 Tax=Cuscuta australis TaxID=267555 RepID=A0A328DRX2_9ASTE|nr:hypothetical protein DM860_005859 [Cuscuta australis]
MRPEISIISSSAADSISSVIIISLSSSPVRASYSERPNLDLIRPIHRSHTSFAFRSSLSHHKGSLLGLQGRLRAFKL